MYDVQKRFHSVLQTRPKEPNIYVLKGEKSLGLNCSVWYVLEVLRSQQIKPIHNVSISEFNEYL